MKNKFYYEFYVGGHNGYSKFFSTDKNLKTKDEIWKFIDTNDFICGGDIRDSSNGNGYVRKDSPKQFDDSEYEFIGKKI